MSVSGGFGGGGGGGEVKKSDDRSRTQKTEEQMCCAKSTTFSQPRIDWLRGWVTSACTQINVSPVRALNRKSFKLYYVRIYEPFQNINSALFEVSVKDSSYSSLCVDSTDWLHTSITCDVWMYERDLFFITKTLSLEAVVKEESMNYPRGTTGPCHEPSEERGKGKGKELLIAEGLRDWKDARRVCLWSCTLPPLPLSS